MKYKLIITVDEGDADYKQNVVDVDENKIEWFKGMLAKIPKVDHEEHGYSGRYKDKFISYEGLEDYLNEDEQDEFFDFMGLYDFIYITNIKLIETTEKEQELL